MTKNNRVTVLESIVNKNNIIPNQTDSLKTIYRFIESAKKFFEYDRPAIQTNHELDERLLLVSNNLLVSFYEFHKCFINDYHFLSLQSIIDYYEGVHFKPYLECFDLLLTEIPNLPAKLVLDEKERIDCLENKAVYNQLFYFHQKHRAGMLKKVRDYDKVEKNNYQKAIKCYHLLKQEGLMQNNTSLTINGRQFNLVLQDFTSWPLTYLTIQRINKALNNWSKANKTTLIRKIFFDIEKAIVSFNLITMGRCAFNAEVVKQLSLPLTPQNISLLRGCYFFYDMKQIDSIRNEVQVKAQYLLKLLAEVEQQYSNSAGELSEAVGELARLRDSVALIRKIEQLQKLTTSKANEEVIRRYFASIQRKELKKAHLDLWMQIMKAIKLEQSVFNSLQDALSNPVESYHTRLPGIYSFQLINPSFLSSL